MQHYCARLRLCTDETQYKRGSSFLSQTTSLLCVYDTQEEHNTRTLTFPHAQTTWSDYLDETQALRLPWKEGRGMGTEREVRKEKKGQTASKKGQTDRKSSDLNHIENVGADETLNL